ncbi:MAG: GWxTD domain-containing protein [Saprospiraceae bacterium]|nr:GWxTD domain-containing protein [Saprospiraceae bacterium]
MKQLTVLIFLLLNSLGSFALDVSFSHCSFNSQQGPYLESYIHVIGSTVSFIDVEGGQKQASVEVLIIIKDGEKIVAFDKYNLHSPLTATTVNFVDQKTYLLPSGRYTIELEVRDNHQEGNEVKMNSNAVLEFEENQFGQSDIQLLGAYSKTDREGPMIKNGYFLETLPFNFYNKKASKLAFYLEIYNSDKIVQEEFLVRYYIDQLGDNSTKKTVKLGHKKRMPKAVNVVMLQMDIQGLPSGNYFLTVEIRDRNNELLSSREVYFQRSNPFLDTKNLAEVATEDEFVNELDSASLVYGLKAIAMHISARDGEVLNMILKERKNKAMRGFLFRYWAAKNPNSPKLAYERYMEVARAADKTFESGFGYGFESDRGNIFMKYGKPNDIVRVDNELDAPPYEIWVYETFPFTNQSRVKFLFYNPTLGAGAFRLLHSDCRAEINNPQWEVELYRDAAPESINNETNYVDATRVTDSFTRRARRIWEDI